MQIIINGETREYTSKITLEYIINDLGIIDKVMAAAVNMEIVKKDNWSLHTLEDGDKIELLDFVGGG